MTDTLFVGIDTSNYTTSVSAADGKGNILLNEKKLLPVKEGERGLRQSDAVFHHVKQLPEVLSALRRTIEAHPNAAVRAIGVSAAPRDTDGSYMPCFLSGIAAAETAGALLGVPVYRFSHQNGHIVAALYSAKRQDLIGREFIAFHVSGGTTEILRVWPDSETVFCIEKIGGTADINAGQAIDRAGVHMGFSFPAGAEMERLSLTYTGKLPPAKISASGMTCNLSGLENYAQKLYESTADPALVSAFVLDFVARTLSAMRDGVRKIYGEIPIVYAGGVMSCARIKDRLADAYASFAQPQFSSDNACGAALLARYVHSKSSEESHG